MAEDLDGTLDQEGTIVDDSEDIQGTTPEADSHEDQGTTEDDTTDNQGITEKKLSEIDIDELTDDELEKLDLSEFEVDETKSETAEETTSDKTEKQADEPVGDPLKDTKAALTKEQQRRAELEREKRELEAELRKVKSGSFQELSADELEELKWDDPDAYAQYKIDKIEHERTQEEINQDADKQRIELQFNEVQQFAKKRGIDVNDEVKLKDFLTDDKFKQLDQFVTNNFKPNKNGLYTNDQMDKAYKMLFADEIIEQTVREAKLKGAHETVENITRLQKRGNGGSDLDRIKKTGSDKPKSASELTPDDIDRMSEKELEQYEKELAAQV